MKILTLITLITMGLFLVSCGDKDKDDKSSSSSSGLTSNFTTKNGYLNLQSGALEIGNQSYPSQPYMQMVQMALQQAQMQQIPPVNHNGVQKLRARITARVFNYNQQYNYGNPQYPGGYNPQIQGGYQQPPYQQNQLELQQIIFVRNF